MPQVALPLTRPLSPPTAYWIAMLLHPTLFDAPAPASPPFTPSLQDPHLPRFTPSLQNPHLPPFTPLLYHPRLPPLHPVPSPTQATSYPHPHKPPRTSHPQSTLPLRTWTDEKDPAQCFCCRCALAFNPSHPSHPFTLRLRLSAALLLPPAPWASPLVPSTLHPSPHPLRTWTDGKILRSAPTAACALTFPPLPPTHCAPEQKGRFSAVPLLPPAPWAFPRQRSPAAQTATAALGCCTRLWRSRGVSCYAHPMRAGSELQHTPKCQHLATGRGGLKR